MRRRPPLPAWVERTESDSHGREAQETSKVIYDSDLKGLPDDPEEAFVEFERLACTRLEAALELEADARSDAVSWHNELEYMAEVIGAAKVFGIEGLQELSSPRFGQDDIYSIFEQFKIDVAHLCIQLRLRRARRAKRSSVAFDPAAKVKLRHLLDQMRTMVDEEKQLTPRKRDALFARIAELSAEVDSDWSRVESFGALVVEVADAVGEAAGRLEPLRKMVDSIAAAFGKAGRDRDDGAQLPAPREQKRIEPPRKTAPPPARSQRKMASDDEIPF